MLHIIPFTSSFLSIVYFKQLKPTGLIGVERNGVKWVGEGGGSEWGMQMRAFHLHIQRSENKGWNKAFSGIFKSIVATSSSFVSPGDRPVNTRQQIMFVLVLKLLFTMENIVTGVLLN